MKMLRQYQKEGIKVLRENKRYMLTDAPGLGKTLQAAHAADPPVLVACPTYLMFQWKEVILSEWPDAVVKVALGTHSERQRTLDESFDWMIINHEMFQSRKIGNKKSEYNIPYARTLIIDESHHFKSPKASQSVRAREYAKKCERVYLLTGTPIVKNPDDLFMQLSIISPNVFKSYWNFLDQFCTVQRTPWGFKVLGVKNKNYLARVLSRYMLGRTYQDVGMELPPLIENKVSIPMSPARVALYKKVRDGFNMFENDLDLNPLEVIRHLRMLTHCDEKTSALVDLLEDAGPSVIFTWYRDVALSLSDALGVPCIAGHIPASDRPSIAKSASSHIVCTIASMSEGVDLSRYSTVIFYEGHMSPGTVEQAQCRVHRYGSVEPVRTFHMLMTGPIKTIDEIIFQSLSDRELSIREIMLRALGRNGKPEY